MKRKIITVFLAGLMVFAMTACGGGDDKETTEPATTETTEATEATTETTTEALETYKTAYKAQLDAIIDQGGVTGGRLCDMDGDGTPEMLVIHDMTATLFTMKDDQAESIYEGTVGMKYGQTDASYEVLLNESISPVTMILFNSSDEWVDENISAVTVSGGEAAVESLKAATSGENDTPAREELQTFSVDGSNVAEGDYNAEYSRLTTGADSIDPSDAGLDALQSALTQ